MLILSSCDTTEFLGETDSPVGTPAPGIGGETSTL